MSWSPSSNTDFARFAKHAISEVRLSCVLSDPCPHVGRVGQLVSHLCCSVRFARPCTVRALPSLVRVMTLAQGLRQTLSGCEHAERGRFGMSRKKREEHLAAHKSATHCARQIVRKTWRAVVNDQSSHLVAGSL